MVNSDQNNPLLAFIHVPKTGGTSLQAVFEGLLMNARPVFNIHHPDQAATFLQMPKSEQDQYYGVFGHMPFGIDKHVDRSVTYVTFLRDPVERVLSAYSHCLRHPEEPGAAVALEMGIGWTAQLSNVAVARLTQHDFLEQPDAQGLYWIKIPAEVSRDDLERAKASLEECAFIGLHENYEQDIRALSQLEGHRIIIPSILPREKAGTNRVRVSELTADQVAAIRAANALDIELYDHALGLREKWGGPVRPDRMRKEIWRDLTPNWHVQVSGPEEPVSLPKCFGTPAEAWNYGALSAPFALPASSTVRVTIEAISGRTGVCLLTEDCGRIVSERRELSVGAGEEALFLTYADVPTARLCILNFGDPDGAGEVELRKVEYSAG